MTRKEAHDFIRDQMKRRVDSSVIVQQLVNRGVDKKEAQTLAAQVNADLLWEEGDLLGSSPSVLPGIIGGFLAALVSGGLWIVVTLAVKKEFGILAWAIGAVCGLAVVLFSRGKKGLGYQLVSAISYLLGIAIGKYGTFYYLYQHAMAERYGENAALDQDLFSPEIMEAFVEYSLKTLEGNDFIWIALGLATAWGIPKGSIGGKIQRAPKNESTALNRQ